MRLVRRVGPMVDGVVVIGSRIIIVRRGTHTGEGLGLDIGSTRRIRRRRYWNPWHPGSGGRDVRDIVVQVAREVGPPVG